MASVGGQESVLQLLAHFSSVTPSLSDFCPIVSIHPTTRGQSWSRKHFFHFCLWVSHCVNKRDGLSDVITKLG